MAAIGGFPGFAPVASRVASQKSFCESRFSEVDCSKKKRNIYLSFSCIIGKAFCLKPFHTGARCFQFGDTKISVPLKTRGRHVVDTLLTLC